MAKLNVPIYWIELKQPGRLQFVACPKTFTLDKEMAAKAFNMTHENFSKKGERYRLCESTIEIDTNKLNVNGDEDTVIDDIASSD